jgi:hypothetical protein
VNMHTEKTLNVLAILKAYEIGDEEGLNALIKNGPKSTFIDLVRFVLYLINDNTRGKALLFIDYLHNQLVQDLNECDL